MSGSLRDDLWFVRDDCLDERVAGYVRAAISGAASRLEMEAQALLLLDRLLSHHHLGKRAKHYTGGLSAWAERHCRDYIHAHLASDIPLSELAGVARLSPFHFARMFKISTGLPPHAYQRRCRIQKAQEMLVTTNWSVTEIALAVGYETPQAFARKFRADVGTSPSE